MLAKMYEHQPKIGKNDRNTLFQNNRKCLNSQFCERSIFDQLDQLTISIFFAINSQLDFNTDISWFVKTGIPSIFFWISSAVKSVTVSGLRLRMVKRFLILEAVAEAESVTFVAWLPILDFHIFFSSKSGWWSTWQSRRIFVVSLAFWAFSRRLLTKLSSEQTKRLELLPRFYIKELDALGYKRRHARYFSILISSLENSRRGN